MSSEKILQEYDKRQLTFENFRTDIEKLACTLLESSNINVHKVESRVKNRDSLLGKLERKENKYNELSQITDIIAIRVITFFEDDVDTVADLIKNEFSIDEDNSEDKRLKESETFGYQSLHYVISHHEKRSNLPENATYKDLKCEIQIRSILQHAWAEIEHDIGYKSKIGIPQIAKRNFRRTAALLETADLEFMRLRDTLEEYSQFVKSEVDNAPENVFIDRVSLKSYLLQSNIIKELDNTIIKLYNAVLIDEESNLDEFIVSLKFLKIHTIDTLDKLLRENKEAIITFANLLYKQEQKNGSVFSTLSVGISIFTLADLIVCRTDDADRIKTYYNLPPKPNNVDEYIKPILNAYKELDDKYKAPLLQTN